MVDSHQPERMQFLPRKAFEDTVAGTQVPASLRQHYLDQVQRVFRAPAWNSQPLAVKHGLDGSPNVLKARTIWREGQAGETPRLQAIGKHIGLVRSPQLETRDIAKWNSALRLRFRENFRALFTLIRLDFLDSARLTGGQNKSEAR